MIIPPRSIPFCCTLCSFSSFFHLKETAIQSESGDRQPGRRHETTNKVKTRSSASTKTTKLGLHKYRRDMPGHVYAFVERSRIHSYIVRINECTQMHSSNKKYRRPPGQRMCLVDFFPDSLSFFLVLSSLLSDTSYRFTMITIDCRTT